MSSLFPSGETPTNYLTLSRSSELKFLFVFIFCYAILHALYFFVPDYILCDWINHYTIVILSADVINYFAPQEMVAAVGNKLVSHSVTLNVVRGCDGAGATFLLIAAIVAFRAKLKDKVLGILVGAFLLYTINQLRIIGLYFVMAHDKQWFVLIHTYIAPSLIVILSSVFFTWWALRASSNVGKSNANDKKTIA